MTVTQTQPIADYLAAHPHPTYVDMPQRLHDLTVGPHGDRAGDLILVAHNGDREDPAQRYYFAPLYHSWHGSPSARDSELPLIVARRGEQREALRRVVETTFAGRHDQRLIADLLLRLRQGAPAGDAAQDP